MLFFEVFKSFEVLGTPTFTAASIHKFAELHRHTVAITSLAEFVLNFFSGFGVVDYHLSHPYSLAIALLRDFRTCSPGNARLNCFAVFLSPSSSRPVDGRVFQISSLNFASSRPSSARILSKVSLSICTLSCQKSLAIVYSKIKLRQFFHLRGSSI